MTPLHNVNDTLVRMWADLAKSNAYYRWTLNKLEKIASSVQQLVTSIEKSQLNHTIVYVDTIMWLSQKKYRAVNLASCHPWPVCRAAGPANLGGKVSALACPARVSIKLLAPGELLDKISHLMFLTRGERYQEVDAKFIVSPGLLFFSIFSEVLFVVIWIEAKGLEFVIDKHLNFQKNFS